MAAMAVTEVDLLTTDLRRAVLSRRLSGSVERPCELCQNRLNEILGDRGGAGNRRSNRQDDADLDAGADCMDWDDDMLKGKKSQ
eukprot:327850-Hanusia_phi.AAC.1